jgi:hypothetical protein
MRDIACGIQECGLAEFAARLGASHMGQWLDLGLYDEGLEGWGQAFEQAVTRTLAAGGRIHFSLDGLDIQEAMNGDPESFTGRYTAFELQQIVRHVEWFESTTFHLNATILSAQQLADLGIELANSHE